MPKLYYGNIQIEIVDSYVYLGVCFNYNGRFTKNKTHLCEQANRAMYSLLRKISCFQLETDTQLVLFDSLILPVLLYGCEIWGHEIATELEKIYTKFCKNMLHLNRSTSTVILYGKLGRAPLDVTVKYRMVSFWARLVWETKISALLYRYINNLVNDQNYYSEFHNKIKTILNECAFSYIWNAQACDETFLKRHLKTVLM